MYVKAPQAEHWKKTWGSISTQHILQLFSSGCYFCILCGTYLDPWLPMYWKGETMWKLVPCALGFFALADILRFYLVDLYLMILAF